jgi:glycosyltransferase involved in cell wall biosynthesis
LITGSKLKDRAISTVIQYIEVKKGSDLKVSIITVVYNNKKHIRDAILSVLGQTYKNVEYIVIDGGSTDGTKEIIGEHKDKIAEFISEKDKGIYDALNKGLKLATGDVVGILHSDDLYFDVNAISTAMKVFEQNKVESVYSDILYVDSNDVNKMIRYWRSSLFVPGAFRKGWHPPHTSFFVKNDVYKKYGYFNSELSVSADFELMLRFLERYSISTHYISTPLVKMRIGGESNKSLINIITGNINCYKAFKMNGINVSPLYFLYRLLPKLGQFFLKSK